jgi:uncharacterized membrane protein YdjX (TVP38/TMEM64 family)
MRRSHLTRLVVALTLAAGGAACLIFLPVKDYALQFLHWVQGLGAWGLVLAAAAFTPACLLFLPGSPISLGAGAIFGLVPATIAMSIGSTIGATAAFLAGRTLVRGLIEERIARHPKFAAIDRAVAQQGFKIVLLARLSPVLPFNLLNYAFGLTRVRLRDYVLASWIGMFPGTVMYVYLGSAVKNLAALVSGDFDGGPAAKTLFFVGLAATVVVTVLVTRVAKRALDQAVADQHAADQQSDRLMPTPSEQPECLERS